MIWAEQAPEALPSARLFDDTEFSFRLFPVFRAQENWRVHPLPGNDRLGSSAALRTVGPTGISAFPLRDAVDGLSLALLTRIESRDNSVGVLPALRPVPHACGTVA